MTSFTPHDEPTSWLHPDIEVRRSRIEGRGLFATAAIRRGTVVARLRGREVSTAELERLIAEADANPAAAYVDTIGLGEDTHLILAQDSNVHYGNHSCDPNLWHVGPVTLAARRDVAAGEEVTVDYGTQATVTGWSMPCACGSPLCRHVVTGADWRRAELRERYGRHWVAPLLRLIDADVEDLDNANGSPRT
jgi:hypothetical protein